MSQIGDTYYAWSADATDRGGQVVSSLMKYLLSHKMVDVVLAVRKGIDIYDPIPVFITDPAEIDSLSGSFHCGTLLLPKLIKKYLNGARDLRVALPCKGCDAKALYELAKRNQINLDNVISIGLNCAGTFPPQTARKMLREEYGVNPDSVVKEGIAKGKFMVKYKEQGEVRQQGHSIHELEEKGYGRRMNCRRCETKIPRQCDLACGHWGVVGDKERNTTFVEICSEKGAKIFDAAVAEKVIYTSEPGEAAVEMRKKIEQKMIHEALQEQEKQFGELGEGFIKLQKIMEETSRCIKCYSCVQNCPICYCSECCTKNPGLVEPGLIPPDFTFHQIRFAHIAISCANCGQCQELCPMDIPNSLFMHAQQKSLENEFGFKSGYDLAFPVFGDSDVERERAERGKAGLDQKFKKAF